MVQENGYCIKHDPDAVKAKDYLKQKEELLLERERELELRGQMIEKSLDTHEIIETIGRVQDLESLKTAELAIIQGLVAGDIDPKAGGPVASLLKHHADLLKAERPDGTLKEEERKQLMQLSLSLSINDAWLMLQDLAGGMKQLIEKAKQEAAITILPENSDEAQDTLCIGVGGASPPAGSAGSLFSEEGTGDPEIQDGDSADTE